MSKLPVRGVIVRWPTSDVPQLSLPPATTSISPSLQLKLDPAAAYVHMTTNNTLFGTQWHGAPDVGEVPLVADMSSDFMWKPFDVS